jgi:hypothetical protein
MAKDRFIYPESKKLCDLLDRVAHDALSNRDQVFEDWLVCMVANLSNGQMEEEYMRTIPPYTKGEKGQRPIDRLCEAFRQLVIGSAKRDILGDLFTGAITHAPTGQFFTPEWLCGVMVRMGEQGEELKGKSVMDCSCGSGRMLLSLARASGGNRYLNTYYGVDVDRRCALMTTVNLAIHDLPGLVVWGDSLSLEAWGGFRIDRAGSGVVVTPLTKEEVQVVPGRELPD